MQGISQDRRFSVFANGVGSELFWATLLFTAFFAAYFSPVWWAGGVLAPGDGAISYFPLFHQPWALISDQLLMGYPIGADLQAQTNYPLKLLLPTYNAFVISAYVAMAVGTYAFLAAYTESRIGALIGAMVTAGGGFMIAHLGHATIIHSACWLPWMLWGIYCGSQRANWPAVCVGATAFALSLLGGHPQVSIIGLGLAGAFWIFLCLMARAENRPVRGVVTHGAWIFGMGIMLSAVSVIPFVELASQGVRAGWALADFDSFSETPRTLLLTLFPAIFGTNGNTLYGSYHGPWNLTELALYAGIGPLILAGTAILAKARNPHVWFWGGALVVALLLSLGASTPFGKIVYHLPVLGSFRAQGRYGLIYIVSCAVLASLAVRGIETGKVKMSNAVMASLGLLVLVGLGLCAIAIKFDSIIPHQGIGTSSAAEWMPRSPAVLVPCVIALFMALLVPLWLRWGGRAIALIAFVAIAADLASFGMFYEWRFITLTPEMRTVSALTSSQVEKVRVSGTRALPVLESQLMFGPFTPQANVSFGVPLAANYGPLLPERAQRFGMLDTTGHPHFDVQASPLANILGVGWFALVPGGAIFDQAVLSRNCGSAHDTPSGVNFAVPPHMRASKVRIVSHTACSVAMEQGETVATVHWSSAAGAADLPLRAGVDTAEWAIDRPGIQAKHGRAQIARSFLSGSETGYDYVTTIPLGRDVDYPIEALSLDLGRPANLALRIRRVELIESDGRVIPLSPEWPGLKMDMSNSALSLARREPQPPLQWTACSAKTLSKLEIQRATSAGFLPDGSRFDPYKVALLEKRRQVAEPSCEKPAMIRDVIRHAGFFHARVEGVGSSILVLSQLWYPGWHARIDGVSAKLVPVDGLIQGLSVPSGAHTVELRFRPVSFIVGVVITGIAILLLVAPVARRYIQTIKSRRAAQ